MAVDAQFVQMKNERNEYNYELLNVAEQSSAIKNEVIYHDKKRIK